MQHFGEKTHTKNNQQNASVSSLKPNNQSQIIRPNPSKSKIMQQNAEKSENMDETK